MSFSGNSGCVARETFEGSTLCYSGFSSNCNYAWTSASGTTVFNYTTAPAPLQGTYSLRVPDASGIDANKTFFGYTASATAYAGMAVNLSAYPSANISIFNMEASVDSPLCGIVLYGNSLLQVTNSGGTTQSVAISGLTAGNTYYYRMEAIAGTGTNATCTAWLSTNGTSWNYTISSTNGTWTASTQYLHFLAPTGSGLNVSNLIADDLRVAMSPFNYW